MPEISATDAARNFAALLDAVEHAGEHYTIVRRGRRVAELHSVSLRSGADIKGLLRRHRIDADWRRDLLRSLLVAEERF